MRGILLCGGNGTRLRPLTYVVNKHLLPIYSKPMILYPLETLKSMGITEVMLVTGGEHLGSFSDFLGDGSKYGVNLTYKVQTDAGGIAQALSLGEDFIQDQFAVILGDNIFEKTVKIPSKCGIVVKKVTDPKRFGVFYKGEIIEKPQEPLSDYAVTGLYFYTPEIFKFIKTLKPSARGEMEITSVNNWCLQNLNTEVIEYDGFWSDCGTFDSMLTSSNWVKNEQKYAAI